jgi:hypothetical protein
VFWYTCMESSRSWGLWESGGLNPLNRDFWLSFSWLRAAAGRSATRASTLGSTAELYIKRRRTNREAGQAVIATIVALGVVMLGAMGLAIDGAQIYAHREMAQAAADAAADAGATTIFEKTTATGMPGVGTGYTCSTTNTSTPCVYARNNGFGLTASDTVSISFPSSPYNGVTGSSHFTYPFVQVTIVRTLPTTFMQLLGTSSTKLTAVATAGVVQRYSALPILVLHPTMAGALELGPKGSAVVTITGGTSRAIQVNSSSSSALIVAPSATIDLSGAGPAHTGADLGVFGPAAQPNSSQLKLGTGQYVQPAAPIADPFLSLTAPARPAAGTTSTISIGKNGCNNSAGCTLYSPGSFTGDIVATRSNTFVFAPGVYYIVGGNFGSSGAGSILMCTGCATSPTTGSGVLVYLSGSGIISITGGGAVSLVGSDTTSTYQGILFFSDHNAPAQTHTISGAGSLSLIGTVYLTNASNTSASKFQTLTVANSGGSGTTVNGEVISDSITLTGAATITMKLNAGYTLPIDQIALIQ